MKKLVLTGPSGFLGWHILQQTQEDWELVGLHHRNAPMGIISYPVDLMEASTVLPLLEAINPDGILHLAANSSVADCQQNPAQSYQLNVQASKNLAAFSKRRGIPFLFTSSEQIFDGQKQIYVETDQPNPINEYGKQKLAAEMMIQAVNPHACIARISVLFGHHGSSAYCFMTDWLEQLQNNRSITVFHDEIRSFLSGRYAAEALFFLLNQKAQGIYHIGGKTAASRQVFAEALAQVAGIQKPLIKVCSQKDIPGLAANRPQRLVLNTKKLSALGGPEGKSLTEELAMLFENKFTD